MARLANWLLMVLGAAASWLEHRQGDDDEDQDRRTRRGAWASVLCPRHV